MAVFGHCPHNLFARSTTQPYLHRSDSHTTSRLKSSYHCKNFLSLVKLIFEPTIFNLFNKQYNDEIDSNKSCFLLLPLPDIFFLCHEKRVPRHAGRP